MKSSITLLLFAVTLGMASVQAGKLGIEPATDDPVQTYARQRLQAAFAAHPDYPDTSVRCSIDNRIAAESYRTHTTRTQGGLEVLIQAGDSRGLLYGSMTLLEQLKGGADAVMDSAETARFPFRAIKFNLPWVSYRAGEALELHAETCRDLKFWEAFLDMMADNRFNTLTLWSLHPFHLMIRNEKYPEACDLTDEELAGWQNFWRSLFAMAAERGIDTYLVNWNIFVSPAFAKHHQVAEYCLDPSGNFFGPGDTSDLVKDYTRTTVTQVLDTYPDLTGLGISHGERMGEMTPEERQQWIGDTFVQGIQAAQRPARFIHRLPFSAGKGSGGSTDSSTEKLTRAAIESLKLPQPIITEAKFNWSHGHSTPKLVKVHGGKLGDTYWNPPPTNYKMNWMVRNEDFFALRWCETDFIRKHVEINGTDYVGGYYIGSECYIPAKDYITIPELRTGYAFERQWLYYKAWGRLLYNPTLDDGVFINACVQRYGEMGQTLFQALKLASRMPLRLASFFDSTWDFTLYSEGFLSNHAKSNPERLITVEELINRKCMDPDYQSVKDFIKAENAGEAPAKGLLSPMDVAQNCIEDGQKVLALLAPIAKATPAGALDLEAADARAWAYLSIYFGKKIQAAVSLCRFRQSKSPEQGKLAVQCLQDAVEQWKQLARLTESTHAEMPLAHISEYKNNGVDTRRFHWRLLLPAVEAELKNVQTETAAKP